MQTDFATAFLRWTFARAMLARGYWVITALYLVVVAHLSPFELVMIGTFQSLTVVAAEIPAGVLADAVSRRRTLVSAHVVMGGGMAMAGLVTTFPLLAVSQCLWGLGWALSSGADVAWLTDELDQPDRVDRVLAAQGRWDLLGNPAGIVVFALLAWATSLPVAIRVSGVAMVVLGLVVVARLPETRFRPVAAGRRARASAQILRHGIELARRDRGIRVVLAATFLVNGSAVAFGRLFELRLVTAGMPTRPKPIVWFAALTIAAFLLGAIALRVVESRIEGVGVARRAYAGSCGLGVVGLLLFALGPGIRGVAFGAFVASGTAYPVTRTVGTIAVNRRTTSAARATVHSLLSQAENVGEIVCGVALAFVAISSSTTAALLASAVLLAAAGALIAWSRPEL
jgi:MFS family permease